MRRLKDVQSCLSILDRKPPDFEPGTAFQDSGVGYLLLGRIIELASGEDYYGTFNTTYLSRPEWNIAFRISSNARTLVCHPLRGLL